VEALTKRFVEHAKLYCEHKHTDMITSCHVFLQEMLVEKLVNKVKQCQGYKNNLSFSGGSALNIKWNSVIIEVQLFEDIWVPPFTNGSGSAIGVALVLK
jgi:carbamoyltransferase